jgi:MarR family transcriptional regulator, lower aerobic nicotinate degradation pathway regulator
LKLEEASLGYLMNKASRLVKNELNNRLNEIGLTSIQFIMLRDIHRYQLTCDYEQQLSLASIADRMMSDRPTITGMIQRLEREGWVKKVQSSSDKRSYYILLTDKTKDTMPQIEKIGKETLELAVTGFSDAEVEAFKNALMLVIHNLL